LFKNGTQVRSNKIIMLVPFTYVKLLIFSKMFKSYINKNDNNNLEEILKNLGIKDLRYSLLDNIAFLKSV
jgi:endo-1,4-beta-mannosidase